MILAALLLLTSCYYLVQGGQTLLKEAVGSVRNKDMGDSSTPVKFGVMGAANIARKNIRALKLARNCQLIAVASRSMDKLEKYAKENDLDSSVRLLDNYQSLLDDPDIQAVYMPLPTVAHTEWVKKAAKAKKHIILEKPVALSHSEFLEMVKDCRREGVNLMDGTMFMHHDRYSSLLKHLNDPVVGEVKHIRSSFSFNGGQEFLDTNIRASNQGDPLGCLGDLGWYSTRLGLSAFSGFDIETQRDASGNIPWKATPKVVAAKCFRSTKEGVPLECECRVGFGSKDDPWSKSLQFDCSFTMPFRQTFEISVTGGNVDEIITCDDFVIPRVEHGTMYNIEHVSPVCLGNDATLVMTTRDPVKFGLCRQEVKMFESMASAIQDNELKDFWPQIAWATQKLMDACMLSMKSGGSEIKGLETEFENYYSSLE